LIYGIKTLIGDKLVFGVDSGAAQRPWLARIEHFLKSD
jgi:hypothetical protein